MKRTPFIAAALASLMLASSLPAKVTITPSTADAIRTVPTRIKWEYRTFEGSTPLSERQLNEYGEKGFELVGFTLGSERRGSAQYIYIFKRPKEVE